MKKLLTNYECKLGKIESVSKRSNGCLVFAVADTQALKVVDFYLNRYGVRPKLIEIQFGGGK